MRLAITTPYELAPTAAELTGWIHAVDDLCRLAQTGVPLVHRTLRGSRLTTEGSFIAEQAAWPLDATAQMGTGIRVYAPAVEAMLSPRVREPVRLCPARDAGLLGPHFTWTALTAPLLDAALI